MSKPVCVVWMNEAKVYEQALARAGLTDKFELHTLKLDEKLADDWPSAPRSSSDGGPAAT